MQPIKQKGILLGLTIKSKNKSGQPLKFFMQNQAKNLEFFISLKKRPKDDLILARKHFPTLSEA